MSKDPAFLFYSSDFLSGITDLTMEERGQYITLLCLQHQKGHLSKKIIDLQCHGNATADVMAKFRQDSDGNFFNERLEAEREKRQAHSKKQSERAKEGWKKRKKANTNTSRGNATAMPLENEDVDEDIDANRTIIKKGAKKEIPDFEEFHSYAKTFDNYNSGFDFAIKAKYDAWKEVGWKDGHGKPIKNWKSKLRNTWPHMKPLHGSQNSDPRRSVDDVFTDLMRPIDEPKKIEWNNPGPKEIE